MLLDIKHINEEMHQKLTSVTARYTRNFTMYLQVLKKSSWIHYMVVEGYAVDPLYVTMIVYIMLNLINGEFLPLT